MLHRYAFLVKNLRGVLAGAPADNLEAYVPWLSRRFRYRDLGVPPCILRRAPSVFEGRLGGNPFHELHYPTASVEHAAREMANRLSSATGLDECLAHSLLLASAYASPVIALPGAAAELLSSRVAVHIVKGPVMDAQQARLHLRIVDYTVLDAYIESIEEAVEAIESGGEPSTLRERRLERARRDEKRYWRIAGKGDKPVIIYLDHVSPLLEGGYRPPTGPEERVLLAQLAVFNLEAVSV
ncbi:hypothetical protein Pyrfu_0573 [Pyrolobus fumarii 1A]|uniref:Uncharacterized protein n=1 Tax=Pyrolobus fumarii (strain DSM 11204 / 1A) TaxID=694429 RepID=G0EGZ3_PYRF1|nr:hypothetical protein [Pyrolobus fumarii]AEM38443.1 hypothetical protein Pyrfu_0573 [Pyrolobus fumarii 1A]